MKQQKRIAVFVLLILFFLMLGLVIFKKNIFLDQAIYQFVISFRCTFLDSYFTFITKFGNPVMVLVLVFFFLLVFRNQYGIFLGVSASSCGVINFMIKHLIKRNRPIGLKLISQGGYSFPSGHAMISVCVYGYLLYCVIQKVNNKFLKVGLSIALVFLILSIGISRIYVGVHYPTDVIAGYSLATILVFIVTEIQKRIYEKGQGNHV